MLAFIQVLHGTAADGTPPQPQEAVDAFSEKLMRDFRGKQLVWAPQQAAAAATVTKLPFHRSEPDVHA